MCRTDLCIICSGGAPDIETLKVVRYESSEDVKAALLDGSLDIVWGSNVLSPEDITDIEIEVDSDLSVNLSDDILNAIILINSGSSPTDDIDLRMAIIAAIDRKKLIDDNLGGLYQPVETVFPRDAPFSGKFLVRLIRKDASLIELNAAFLCRCRYFTSL